MSAAWAGTAPSATERQTAGSGAEARADAEVWVLAHPGATARLDTGERARVAGGKIVWERP